MNSPPLPDIFSTEHLSLLNTPAVLARHAVRRAGLGATVMSLRAVNAQLSNIHANFRSLDLGEEPPVAEHSPIGSRYGGESIIIFQAAWILGWTPRAGYFMLPLMCAWRANGEVRIWEPYEGPWRWRTRYLDRSWQVMTPLGDTIHDDHEVIPLGQWLASVAGHAFVPGGLTVIAERGKAEVLNWLGEVDMGTLRSMREEALSLIARGDKGDHVKGLAVGQAALLLAECVPGERKEEARAMIGDQLRVVTSADPLPPAGATVSLQLPFNYSRPSHADAPRHRPPFETELVGREPHR